MAKCDHCGAIIVSGGIRSKGRRYCGEPCYEAGYLGEVAEQLPTEEVERHTRKVYEGDCPVCGHAGPVDVHTAHYVWSALVVTRHWSESVVCCRACGRGKQTRAALYCAGLGLWGLPWGLIFTPIQISRNLSALRGAPADGPSAALWQTVALRLAEEEDERRERQERRARRDQEA